MALISDLLSASAHLHNPMASEEYDRRVRELVDYFKKLLSTKTLDSSANDESSLDVRPTPLSVIRIEQHDRLTCIFNSILTRRQIRSHIFTCLVRKSKGHRSEAATYTQQTSALRGSYGHALPNF